MMANLLYSCIFLLLILDSAYSDCKTNYECSSSRIGASEFCTKECELAPVCDELPIDAKCEDGEFMQLYDNPKDYCNCCPAQCIKYKKENDECEPLVSDRVPTEMCGPRLGNYRFVELCKIILGNYKIHVKINIH